MSETDRTKRRIHAYRLSDQAPDALKTDDEVVVEVAVTVMIDKIGSFTLMATPCDIEALAVGFAHAEGMIDSRDDVVGISVSEKDPSVVGLEVADPSRASAGRNMIVMSSCGLCGARTIEKRLEDTTPCGRTFTIRREVLLNITERLREHQQLFADTGGSHAAGVFTGDGEFIAVAEDVARHNAVDKAIGKCILAGRSTVGCGLALSSRISFEMVSKAARAGIELIAAVSAPSSFAVACAERWDITLCGFVRGLRANIYTHPERVENTATS